MILSAKHPPKHSYTSNASLRTSRTAHSRISVSTKVAPESRGTGIDFTARPGKGAAGTRGRVAVGARVYKHWATTLASTSGCEIVLIAKHSVVSEGGTLTGISVVIPSGEGTIASAHT